LVKMHFYLLYLRMEIIYVAKGAFFEAQISAPFLYNRKLHISYYIKTRFNCPCKIFAFGEMHMGKQSVNASTAACGERCSRFVVKRTNA